MSIPMPRKSIFPTWNSFWRLSHTCRFQRDRIPRGIRLSDAMYPLKRENGERFRERMQRSRDPIFSDRRDLKFLGINARFLRETMMIKGPGD